MARLLYLFAVVGCAGALTTACDETTGFPDSRPPDGPSEPGSITMTWSFSGGESCKDVGANGVVFSYRLINSPNAEVDSFSCDSLGATTPSVDAGTYQLTFQMVTGGNVVATAPVLNDVVVEAGADTDIGNIEFVPE